MRILIAPDKFKGSLSANQVAQAIKFGLQECNPDLQVAVQGLADGGEGSVSAALSAGFDSVPITVSGPTGDPLSTKLAIKNRLVIIEAASICGLGVLPEGRFAPLKATSFGIGEAILEALRQQPKTIVLALGGVATTDGGAGMLQALGAELLTASGKSIQLGGAGLLDLESAKLENAQHLLNEVELVIASDVTNPLLGPKGTASVYGPQKGASKVDLRLLESALATMVSSLKRSGAKDAAHAAAVPGAGAAGGLGFAGLLLQGRVRSGADYFLSLLDIDHELRRSDVVITGEGSLDSQSLSGKLPIVLAKHAARQGIPTYAIVGRCTLTAEETGRYFRSVITLTSLSDQNPAQNKRLSLQLLEQSGYQLADQLRF